MPPLCCYTLQHRSGKVSTDICFLGDVMASQELPRIPMGHVQWGTSIWIQTKSHTNQVSLLRLLFLHVGLSLCFSNNYQGHCLIREAVIVFEHISFCRHSLTGPHQPVFPSVDVDNYFPVCCRARSTSSSAQA